MPILISPGIVLLKSVIHQLGCRGPAQQFPENIDNRIKLETRITARSRLNVIQPAGDRLTMKIGHRCQLIDIEAKVFQFVIHDDEQYLTISTS